MTLHVQGQVIRARKSARAELAAEGALSGVFSVVAGQLVGACESPAAAFPRAGIRLLPWEVRKLSAPLPVPHRSLTATASGRTSFVQPRTGLG